MAENIPNTTIEISSEPSETLAALDNIRTANPALFTTIKNAAEMHASDFGNPAVANEIFNYCQAILELEQAQAGPSNDTVSDADYQSALSHVANLDPALEFVIEIQTGQEIETRYDYKSGPASPEIPGETEGVGTAPDNGESTTIDATEGPANKVAPNEIPMEDPGPKKPEALDVRLCLHLL